MKTPEEWTDHLVAELDRPSIAPPDSYEHEVVSNTFREAMKQAVAAADADRFLPYVGVTVTLPTDFDPTQPKVLPRRGRRGRHSWRSPARSAPADERRTRPRTAAQKRRRPADVGASTGRYCYGFSERATGIEPATFSLGS